MLAKALEHNGATVYIVGRRLDVLETAAHEESVSAPSPASRSASSSCAPTIGQIS